MARFLLVVDSLLTRRSLLAGTPNAVHHLRRPRSTEADFWHISEARWNDAIVKKKSKDKKEVKVALNTLRKFDAAGRIMTGGEGIDAPTTCSWCKRPGHEVACRVFANGKDKACAYCKRHGKKDCEASTVPEKEGDKMDVDQSSELGNELGNELGSESAAFTQRVTKLEKENDDLKAEVGSLKEEVVGLKERLTSVEEKNKALLEEVPNMTKDLNVLWDRVFSPAPV